MTSLPFDYERPDSLNQALSLIAEPGSVLLAGGQSLVPLLNRRVVTPKRIVDITRIPDLKKIELGDDVMRIGAIVRLADIEKHTALAHFPLLADFHPKGEVSQSYGAYRHPEGVCERALFVIDSEGTIRWSYLSPIGVNPGADGILAALEELQTRGQTK